MNIYDEPEKFGLVRIGEVDLGGGYSSDKFVVWSFPERNLAALGLPDAWAPRVGWATASNCSCATDFEGLGIFDLTWGTEPECTSALNTWFNGKDEFVIAEKEGRVTDLSVKIWNRT